MHVFNILLLTNNYKAKLQLASQTDKFTKSIGTGYRYANISHPFWNFIIEKTTQ